jgi:hypothetical protein
MMIGGALLFMIAYKNMETPSATVS